MRSPVGIIYLLHLEPKFKHAGHYLGWSGCLVDRLQMHRSGSGSRLLAYAVAAGSELRLVRIWTGTRERERKFKSRALTRLCPVCNPPRPGAPGPRRKS